MIWLKCRNCGKSYPSFEEHRCQGVPQAAREDISPPAEVPVEGSSENFSGVRNAYVKRWRKKHTQAYRDYMREYMKARRAKAKLPTSTNSEDGAPDAPS